MSNVKYQEMFGFETIDMRKDINFKDEKRGVKCERSDYVTKVLHFKKDWFIFKKLILFL